MSAILPTKPIGSTGIGLSRIGFGSAPMGDLKRTPTNEIAHDLLQAAWDEGIRYFDTAPFYGSGMAERRLGDFLRDKPRDEYVLSTKVGRTLVPDRAWALQRFGGDPRAMPFRPQFDFTYDAVMRGYEQSLQRLGLERIDILFLHDIGRYSQGDNHEKNLKIALDSGAVKALQDLRAQGAVKAIGVGVNEWQILDELMNHAKWDVFLLANRYTLMDQAVLDGFLQRVEREDIAIVDGAPLHSGLLVHGAREGAMYDYAPASAEVLDKVRRIQALCEKHGVPLVRAGLNFPLGHPAVTSIIPGPSNAPELRDNLAHFRTAVPSALWDDLKAEGLIHPASPAPATPALA